MCLNGHMKGHVFWRKERLIQNVFLEEEGLDEDILGIKRVGHENCVFRV